MSKLTRKQFLSMLAMSLAGVATASRAQSYPVKPIRIIVPTVPGGGTDFIARFIAQQLGPALGQPVTVDNRAGADGQIGVEIASKSPPDGYTLVIPITSFSSSPSLYDRLPFDTVKDFEPVVMVSRAPLLLVVNPKIPAKTVGEFIAYAKSNPGRLSFGNSGVGTMSNLSAHLFNNMAGLDIVPVSYKGAGQLMTDLVSGQIQMYFSTIPAALQLVNAGKLRALGISSPTRLANMPEIRSIAESGLPGFDVVSWFALFAPAGTPRPIVGRLNEEVRKILAQPETQDAFGREGLIPDGDTPEALGKFLVADIARWKKVILDAGLKRS